MNSVPRIPKAFLGSAKESLWTCLCISRNYPKLFRIVDIAGAAMLAILATSGMMVIVGSNSCNN